MTAQNPKPQFKLMVERLLGAELGESEANHVAEGLRAEGNRVRVEVALPEGLSREQLSAIVNEYGVAYFRPGAERVLARLERTNSDEYGDDAFERFDVVGGDLRYVVVKTGEEYDDALDAMKALGAEVVALNFQLDGEAVSLQSLIEAGEIEMRPSRENLWPPMWSAVWRTDWLPPTGKDDSSYFPGVMLSRAQSIAEFTGVTVYSDEVGDDFVIGINGAGYDFYSEHWIPLAYLWGEYSA